LPRRVSPQRKIIPSLCPCVFYLCWLHDYLQEYL
jgi:hypothetical protein